MGSRAASASAVNSTNAAQTPSTPTTVPAGILRRSIPAHSRSESSTNPRIPVWPSMARF